MTDTSPRPFVLYPGTAPLLVSMPHAGTYVPPALAARFTDEARQVPDTDWHMERLYAFAKDLGASILVATHSRYVVDLNRPPDGTSLYPGQSVTGLCPVDTFDDTPIYARGDVPMMPRWPRAAMPSGCRITRNCVPSWTASARSMVWRCCGTLTPSARCCRASLKAS